MTLLWLALAGVTFVAYAAIEWRITSAIAKGIMTQEQVQLRGSKAKYILFSALLSFLTITFLFFALQAYGDAPFQPVCWLAVSLVVSSTVTLGMYARLRFVTFKKVEE